MKARIIFNKHVPDPDSDSVKKTDFCILSALTIGAAHSALAITWKNKVVVTLKNAETWELVHWNKQTCPWSYYILYKT